MMIHFTEGTLVGDEVLRRFFFFLRDDNEVSSSVACCSVGVASFRLGVSFSSSFFFRFFRFFGGASSSFGASSSTSSFGGASTSSSSSSWAAVSTSFSRGSSSIVSSVASSFASGWASTAAGLSSFALSVFCFFDCAAAATDDWVARRWSRSSAREWTSSRILLRRARMSVWRNHVLKSNLAPLNLLRTAPLVTASPGGVANSRENRCEK
mmetsp:Transcript_10768/g.32381  ORF Transcript_10768/g.32381 Transcript_10768/m.32381 type:complete len:210 (+) Transcript_10768:180-809(+)